MNDHPLIRGDLTIIALRPDTGIGFKIGGSIFFMVWVAPEVNGRIRKRLDTDKLAFLLPNRAALVIPDFNRHTEPATLNLALPYR